MLTTLCACTALNSREMSLCGWAGNLPEVTQVRVALLLREAVIQVVEAEELEAQLYSELEGLPKHGKQFAAAIRCILKRETRSVPMFKGLPNHCEQGILEQLLGLA